MELAGETRGPKNSSAEIIVSADTVGHTGRPPSAVGSSSPRAPHTRFASTAGGEGPQSPATHRGYEQ